MPPKKWIDKRTAQTFSLVHRSTDDPLYNDENAPQQVLVKIDDLNSKENKTERKNRYKAVVFEDQDAEKFRLEGRRENEGEAALYGIEFDDSKYDYMQHLKPIGTDPDAVFISKRDKEKKEKKQMGLLLKPEYAASSQVTLPKDVMASETVIKRTYQDQQNIPDAIAGFQPDMDPRLREVLEALEDEEYIDDEVDDDDLFAELLAGGEADGDEDNDYYDDDFDDAEFYDSDGSLDTVKGSGKNDKPAVTSKPAVLTPAVNANGEPEAEWETAFRQFKIDQASSKKEAGFDSDSEAGDGVGALSVVTSATRKTTKGKKKKNRWNGPGTALSGLSMSSSTNYRNQGLQLLDDRFDTIEEEYANDEALPNKGQFDITKERADFESIMDDFLDNYAIDGKKLVHKSKFI